MLEFQLWRRVTPSRKLCAPKKLRLNYMYVPGELDGGGEKPYFQVAYARDRTKLPKPVVAFIVSQAVA